MSSLHKKLTSIPEQERAYIEGTVEYIGDQWIFFDEINEEASELESLENKFQVYRNDSWKNGTLIDGTMVSLDNDFSYLVNGDKIRYRKRLSFSFQELLEELDENAFLNLVRTLNSMSYSLYDCIFCNNFLPLLHKRKEQTGMNVIVFENGDQICIVQHYFIRKNGEYTDRFEFSQSNGNRVVCSYIK
ncbi:DUF2777 family protein [Bacillus sp. Marseille-P3661]|uniref:DUF2777 family protein n=1 Tax=Bacillus sp. Marseille-P3661 TaxID=1936234 RepID=UPI000C83CC0D|nr:DUF2777 family protein [Bacillus sp. Marseille-P3661]